MEQNVKPFFSESIVMLHIKLKGVEHSTIFGLNLHLHPYFVYASSEGPGKTGHLFA